MKSAFRWFGRALAWFLVSVLVVLTVFRGLAFWREQALPQDLAPPNGTFVATASGRIHVSVWGPETGPPVVFTHGMAAWGGLWSETAERLATKGYRIYAIDQPPFGFSDRSSLDYRRETIAGQVNETVAALKLSKPILVGHSYGGGIALEAALTKPDLYQKLILICPVTGVFDPGPREVMPVPLYMRSNSALGMVVSATITNPLMTGTLAKLFMFRKEALTQTHVDILQRTMPLAGNTEAMTFWLQQFVQGPGLALGAVPERVAALAIPVALVWGEKDSVVTMEEGKKLSALMNGAPLTIVPGIGHMPQLEDNAAFNTALETHLVQQ
jgi:pimeloyl-ACP methyl ester carboxylesterase